MRSIPPRSAATLALAMWALSACTPQKPEAVAPAVDGEQLALALEDQTSLEEPVRVVFQWQLNEAGVRVRGRGVARIEPPYKARLDLFLDNGETVIWAALVDGDLRLPPGAPEGILPPADLMWGVLGVFRPQFGIELMGADRMAGGGLRLRYRYADARDLHFGVEGGRIRTVEVLRDGHTTERVEVGLEAGSRYPAEATYRNLAAFRELKLTRGSVERVESFPPDIWDPTSTRSIR